MQAPAWLAAGGDPGCNAVLLTAVFTSDSVSASTGSTVTDCTYWSLFGQVVILA